MCMACPPPEASFACTRVLRFTAIRGVRIDFGGKLAFAQKLEAQYGFEERESLVHLAVHRGPMGPHPDADVLRLGVPDNLGHVDGRARLRDIRGVGPSAGAQR